MMGAGQTEEGREGRKPGRMRVRTGAVGGVVLDRGFFSS